MNQLLSNAKPFVVCLMGPTASGKTALAMALADKIDAQLISVDSAQVYKDLNIGSGKPTPEVLARYPHELIDVALTYEPYSAYEFQQDALQAIEKAFASNKLPILVGGTMLYFKALLQGFAQLPKACPDTRAKIESAAAEQGWPAMHQALSLVDKSTAARLEPNDSQRICRALEVYYVSGIPLSKLIKQQARQELPFNALTIGLCPADKQRKQLHNLIEQRFAKMLEEGLVDEVQQLMQSEHFSRELPAFKSVGYRQAIMHLDGEYDLDTLYEKGCAATRQLAKRQITWLRGWDELKLMDCFDPQLVPNTLELIRSYA